MGTDVATGRLLAMAADAEANASSLVPWFPFKNVYATCVSMYCAGVTVASFHCSIQLAAWVATLEAYAGGIDQ